MNRTLIQKIVKEEWHDLWGKKIVDKSKSESISRKKYYWLDVDKGQVIFAPKNIKILDFHEILIENFGIDEASRINPDPSIGGWRKFAKENFRKKNNNSYEKPEIKYDSTQTQRKGGRGWKNTIRKHRKIKEAD